MHAFLRCLSEVEQRLQRVESELAHLRRGYYHVTVRAANLLFDRQEEALSHEPPRSAAERALSILVVLEPSVAALPTPHVKEGRLIEPYLSLSEGDQAALETALQLRDQVQGTSVTATMVGPRRTAALLRQCLSRGVDYAVLLAAEHASSDSAASALAVHLRKRPLYDLVLGGAGSEGQEGVLARLTGEALGAPYAGTAARLVVHPRIISLYSEATRERLRPLLAAVLLEVGVTLRESNIDGQMAALSNQVEILPWPRDIELRTTRVMDGPARAPAGVNGVATPLTLSPEQAAGQLVHEMGLRGQGQEASQSFAGLIEDVAYPELKHFGAAAIIAADEEGRLLPSAAPVLGAACWLAETMTIEPVLLIVTPAGESIQRRVLAQVMQRWSGMTILMDIRAGTPLEVCARMLADCWPFAATLPWIVGEPWTEGALLERRQRNDSPAELVLRVRRLSQEDGRIAAEVSRAAGKLRERRLLTKSAWLTMSDDAEVDAVVGPAPQHSPRVLRWRPSLERFHGREDIAGLLEEVKRETGLVRLIDADFIIDVGFGIGNRDGYDAVIAPLAEGLRRAGVHGLMVGGSRKATEELHLLPLDRQIGQSGVSVRPRLLLAIGVSGAPQHLNYIAPGTTILAFNRDPEAPLMTLNQRQPRPRVFPVVGDLFETVPAFIAALSDAEAHRRRGGARAAAARADPGLDQ